MFETVTSISDGVDDWSACDTPASRCGAVTLDDSLERR